MTIMPSAPLLDRPQKKGRPTKHGSCAKGKGPYDVHASSKAASTKSQ